MPKIRKIYRAVFRENLVRETERQRERETDRDREGTRKRDNLITKRKNIEVDKHKATTWVASSMAQTFL